MKTLILGGVRSGKSGHAEALAMSHRCPVTVIVTATAGDEEMAARIAAHQARRPAHWRVREERIDLGPVLLEVARAGTVVIIDCLTLWLTNLLLEADTSLLQRKSEALVAGLQAAPGRIILVGNEVGAGVIPVNELARRFTDAAGVLHQRLAQACDRVLWMVAGVPVPVKGVGVGHV